MKNKGKVYRKMIITYALILCIPVLCSIVFYRYTYETVREQSIYYNRNLLETIKTSCDRELLYYKSILQQLRVDDLVKIYVRNNLANVSEQKWNAVEIQNTMNDMAASMRDSSVYCKDIFVYQKDTGEVLSGQTKLNYDAYIDIIIKLDEEEKARVKQIMQNITQSSTYAVELGEKTYLLMLDNLYDNVKSSNAVVGIWIDADVLETRIPSVEWNSGTEWALVSNDGSDLYVTELLRDYADDWTDLELYDNGHITINKQEYMVHKLESKGCDGRYLLFPPWI